MARTYADIAALIAAMIPRPNPVTGGILDGDLYLTNDTPIVTVLTGDATRKAVYLPPHALQVGRPVFVMRVGPGLADDLAVIATNFQVTPGAGAGGGSGSTLGVGAGSAAPSADWAASMTGGGGDDGALLPLWLGEVAR